MPGIAPLESRVGLTVHEAADRPAWAVELGCRLVAAQNRVATSLQELTSPGFSVWDLRSYWRPTPQSLVVAGVENLANRTYREHFDFRPFDPAAANRFTMYQPGVNFYLGSELSY